MSSISFMLSSQDSGFFRRSGGLHACTTQPQVEMPAVLAARPPGRPALHCASTCSASSTSTPRLQYTVLP